MNDYKDLKTPKLQAWLAEWPEIRAEIEHLMATYARRNPSLHFELTLAHLELRDLDEAAQRVAGLDSLLSRHSPRIGELETSNNA